MAAVSWYKFPACPARWQKGRDDGSLTNFFQRLRQLRFLFGGQFFLFVRRRRQFLVIFVQPRLGLREILLGLFHLVGVVADE